MTTPSHMETLFSESSDSLFCEEKEETSLQNTTHHETDIEIAEEEEEDPEFVLVKKVSSAIRAIRAVVLTILVLAAALTAWLVYKYTAKTETEAFEQEYGGVATKILESLKGESISLKFWMARTLATSIHLAMNLTGANAINVTMPTTEWDALTGEMRLQANAHVVSYSPLLFTQSDRQAFEEQFQQQEGAVGNQAGTNPPCWLCQEPTSGYSNPTDEVTVPGFGTDTCQRVENLGRTGIIPESMCEFAKVQVNTVCHCTENVFPENDEQRQEQQQRVDFMFTLADNGTAVPVTANPPFLPIRHVEMLNGYKKPTLYEQMSEPVRARAVRNMMDNKLPVFSETYVNDGPYASNFSGYEGETGAIVFFPVFDLQQEVVGAIAGEFMWKNFMTGIFPAMADHVLLVVENTCGQVFSYTIDQESNHLIKVGEGDLHEAEFADMVYSSTYEDFEATVNYAASRKPDFDRYMEYCRYRYHVYPLSSFQDEYITSNPYVYAAIAAAIFLVCGIVFIFYDFTVAYRQTAVMATARKTHDIVSSLYPKAVRRRLLENNSNTDAHHKLASFVTRKMTSVEEGGQNESSDPIAEFCPHATVVFIDIVNFTSWSSEREPHMVFKLLEAIFCGFDGIAKRMGVFKVETIGDTYVAVVGVPTPRKDHAVVMTRFADQCLNYMHRRTKELETTLGPSTGDLAVRIGIHSGAITAGVLRGEKGRFQLFGDTVNMASRIEGCGMPQMIHASAATAEELRKAGKEHWVAPRDSAVTIKGKGEIQTFWLNPKKRRAESVTEGGSQSAEMADSEDQEVLDKNLRLVQWNTEILCPLLARVVVQRNCRNAGKPRELIEDLRELEEETCQCQDGKIVLDEMAEILEMPSFDGRITTPDEAVLANVLSAEVMEQMRKYVLRISALYRQKVPFHNFEHASHVTMSAGKLMKRILNPEGVQHNGNIEEQIHSITYGMSSDPLMQFSIVFACLIHDVDHTGLPNARLVAENDLKASFYRNQSVAEQNSVDVAWRVLMEQEFADLRACIYADKRELCRFRSLVVNAILATDIADKAMSALRKNRWNVAFSTPEQEQSLVKDVACTDGYRKATIVFEHIIQAADVSHCMQHFQTYRKWNMRLFEEQYLAFTQGRGPSPVDGWYKGELGFFDFYIIPLAEKLKKCGVFGVSYHESVSYAIENRREFEVRGQAIVAEMHEMCIEKYGKAPAEF